MILISNSKHIRGPFLKVVEMNVRAKDAGRLKKERRKILLGEL